MSNATYEGPLGRVPAPDDEHIRKYSLTAEQMPTEPESLVVGIGWPRSFDIAGLVEKRGEDGKPEFWAGLDPNALGPDRGGHCVCLPFDHTNDIRGGHGFFDQGEEGKCVGFGWARERSIRNRRTTDPHSIYGWAVLNDGLAETNGPEDGTTVRAGGDYLLKFGACRVKQTGGVTSPRPADGLARFLWARDLETMLAVLGNDLYRRRGAIPLFNSWGTRYPHVVWVPGETWDRKLFREDGDCCVPVDREKAS